MTVPSAPERDDPPTSRAEHLILTYGAVLGPTTLITGLLYYFGWHHVFWFFAYFGVNATVLDFGVADYLMRSLDALFVPMVVTAVAGLLAFWGHDLLRARLVSGALPRLSRVLVPVLAGAGLLPALGGLWSVFAPTFLREHLVLAPLSLAAGVSLLVYALRLRRALAAAGGAGGGRTTPGADADEPPARGAPPGTADRLSGPRDAEAAGSAGDRGTAGPGGAPAPGRGAARPHTGWAAVAEWTVVFVLVGLSLFWAANDYAAAVGRSRAREFVAGLAGEPTAVLYSARDLSLGAPGVRRTRCHDDRAAYRFRYDGLKLLLQSGNQYVFLPERWTPADGVAVVLPRTDSVRLEFGPPGFGAGRRPTC
ncbi:hypothetical protein [Streptomyces sp. NPDC003077]|uniref:hypothetical protein n=1 Tax=Streptomyces sp. NPDC003077 TaxID=3154443 RepID=UPI0033A1CE06